MGSVIGKQLVVGHGFDRHSRLVGAGHGHGKTGKGELNNRRRKQPQSRFEWGHVPSFGRLSRKSIIFFFNVLKPIGSTMLKIRSDLFSASIQDSAVFPKLFKNAPNFAVRHNASQFSDCRKSVFFFESSF
jgi:hypothetical protein